MITASALIQSARSLIGVPWVHLGRSVAGVDCIGLVLLAAQQAGIDLCSYCQIDPPRVYQRSPSHRLLRMVTDHCERIDSPIPGCLMFFKFEVDKYPRHFGVLTDKGTVIHAESKNQKRVIEHGYRAHWIRWTDSMWKLPGVEYP